ncbi:MAG: bifunctional 5,10-methylene-tetrahydrofolate dehydrogenase/5,10-methylene-tetrahydrofolate cyclohydrolase [Atopobiaceae bacterium]|nr:bifunctional 5,10-methylene-tetrahydrofolate dehydrogenase/5,10-methylene-tetrahydrofolate cyclohydrolase [Atopobiaceae bacterium]
MAQQLLGLPVAKALTERVASRVKALADQGVVPTLAIVRVGEREDDLAYERGAMKRCDAAGIAVRSFVLPSTCGDAELLDVIGRINEDAGIHGCLLFRPLPRSLDEQAACAALDPAKDVDCMTESSLFGVMANKAVGFPPCTAEACVALLDYYGIELDGASVAVVGRSLVIGKPVSLMLQARNATVTMCHTHTKDLDKVCRAADVLVVAAGHPRTIGAGAVRDGQVVVDVGINWDEQAGKLCGDVAYDEVEPIVAGITPVPRGVGSVTTSVLAKHVVDAAERQLDEGALR